MRVPGCAFVHLCVHLFTYSSSVLSSYRVLGTILYGNKCTDGLRVLAGGSRGQGEMTG